MKMKMWIGNYDGSRQGLVIAPTKKRAMEIIGSGRNNFNGYWVLQESIEPNLSPELLYTRDMRDKYREPKPPWHEGRCPLVRKDK